MNYWPLNGSKIIIFTEKKKQKNINMMKKDQSIRTLIKIGILKTLKS
jgi:hypothetical protein